jgi:hypothetical protein
LAAEENVKGKTAAFMTFSPFKSWISRMAEYGVLLGAVTQEQAVRGLEFLHYAFFTRVSPGTLRRIGIPTNTTCAHGGLLFLSAFNGDAEAYFQGFSTQVDKPMNAIWGCCTDWEKANPYKYLDKFIRTYRRPVDAHFNTYPSDTTTIRNALDLRRGIDALMVTALDDKSSDDDFQSAYHQLAQELWGDPRRDGRGS